MKFLLEATSDVSIFYADRLFQNKKGETIELNGVGAEMALSEDFAGAYKIVREIPETDDEKSAVKVAEDASALKKLPKDKLVKQAEKLHIVDADLMGKEPLADAIADAKSEIKTSKGDK